MKQPEQSEVIDWDSKSVPEIKAYLKQNSLNEEFGKFAGHGIRKAKKAEFVAFLNQWKS